MKNKAEPAPAVGLRLKMACALLASALMAALAGGVLVTDAVQRDGQLQAAAAESRAQLAQARADKLAGQLEAEQGRAALPAGLEARPLGEYLCTAYCAEEYPHICGGNGITASGSLPVPGVTAAADWAQLPPGSVLYIEGVGVRVVEDSGSAIRGNALDILVATHAEAERWPGYGYRQVWLLQGAQDVKEANG